jgi:hypothetical protein
MPKSTPKNIFIKKILEGIEKSYNKYGQYSGDWLDKAPEYFVTCCIAENCSKLKTWVTLETPTKTVLKLSNSKKKGRPRNNLRIYGRIDIVLWWSANGSPRAVIEVKHPVYTANHTSLKSDIERICCVLTNSNEHTIKFGGVAVYISSNSPKRKDANATRKIKRKLMELHKQARGWAKNYQCKTVVHKGAIRRIEDEAWTGAFIEVIRK